MRSILDHASKILFDNDTEPLLTPGFWILPLYRELLNSARRNRPSAASERARGCTGLVKLICKENKEQRGKRKFHEGAPHPNDRGGFTQWFGSCSLINTLYVWFPASWAPMVAERLFGMSSNPGESSNNPQHGQPANQGFPRIRPGCILGTNLGKRLLVPVEQCQRWIAPKWCTKIRQWSLPGAAVMPVLNVSSRVTWLELDDKALLESYTVLQEGILVMFSRKSVQLHGRALLVKGLRSPLCCRAVKMADDWLDFMLSQKNLWPTFTTRGALTEVITEKTFRKERRRLQAKHLWMEVKLSWNVLSNRMYTVACTGKSRENFMRCYSTRLPGAAKRIPMKKKHTVDLHTSSPGMVGAMPRVDAVLQMSMCATGPGH